MKRRRVTHGDPVITSWSRYWLGTTSFSPELRFGCLWTESEDLLGPWYHQLPSEQGSYAHRHELQRRSPLYLYKSLTRPSQRRSHRPRAPFLTRGCVLTGGVSICTCMRCCLRIAAERRAIYQKPGESPRHCESNRTWFLRKILLAYDPTLWPQVYSVCIAKDQSSSLFHARCTLSVSRDVPLRTVTQHSFTSSARLPFGWVGVFEEGSLKRVSSSYVQYIPLCRW